MIEIAASLPVNVAGARLPQTYEAAKTALANCASIDECVDWANKSEALASYARQSEDESLMKMALRIKSRAIRRAGELLKTFNNGVGRPENRDGSGPISQTEAGHDAGMSDRQIKTAVRVANVPEEDFAAAVESDAPPTVTKLADMGKKPHRIPPKQEYSYTYIRGAMARLVEQLAKHDPEYVAGGVLPHEIAEARQFVATIDAWLDRFIVNLRGAA